jgi:CheY-like chemotaxis protein
MSPARRILVVDDEEEIVQVLSEYFIQQGYAVETAANGTEALAALARQRADVVLLDIDMPELNGIQVLRRLRELDSAIPVIMVTANQDQALAEESLRLGALAYVEKPFDFVALGRSVASALARRGAT